MSDRIGFSIIQDGQAVIRHGVVHRQVAIYDRGGKVYAKSGSGFVRVFGDGRTAHTDIKWEDLFMGDIIYPDKSKPGQLEVINESE